MSEIWGLSFLFWLQCVRNGWCNSSHPRDNSWPWISHGEMCTVVQTQNLEPKCTRNHKKCPRLKALFFCLCGQCKEQETPIQRRYPYLGVETGVWDTSGVFGRAPCPAPLLQYLPQNKWKWILILWTFICAEIRSKAVLIYHKAILL